MFLEMKCDYCKENEAEFDLHNFFIYFTEDNKDLGYNICESCLIKLEDEETLESIYGFNVMLIKFIDRKNIKFRNGYLYITCEKCGNKYSILTNAQHILPFNALEEEKQKWIFNLRCKRCGYENVHFN